VDSPLFHFPELGVEADLPVCVGPIKTLSYDVLLHLDRVFDFSVSPASSPESHMSIHSDVSGLPSEGSSSLATPTTWAYRWFLGLEAGSFPPPPPRAPVHSRLRFPGRRDDDGGDDGAAGDAAARKGGGAGRSRRQSRWDQQVWNQAPSSSAAGGSHDGYQHQLAELEVHPVGAGRALGGDSSSQPMRTPEQQELEQVACMPNLLDVDQRPGQTVAM
jgi:hypothetical protein